MWQRKELKSCGRRTLKSNYWACVAVCFLIAIFASRYATSTSALYGRDVEEPETSTSVLTELSLPSDYSGWQSAQFLAAEMMDRVFPKVQETPRYTEGVIATVLIGLRSYYLRFAESILRFIDGGAVAAAIFLLIGGVLGVFYHVFIVNLLLVGQFRFFIESRIYHKTPIQRMLFVYHEKCILHVAKIIFLRDLFLFFWFLTIIGGFIKLYEYRMIPYILAENPRCSSREAFALSKKMMHANKWRTFILDISFWYWHLLTIASCGLVGFFYLNPYREATIAELYIYLRESALAEQMDGSEILNDRWLVEPPDADQLAAWLAEMENSETDTNEGECQS